MHKDICGVTWIDDSKATNVEAAYVGLMGLRRQKCVVLLGGLAKVRFMHITWMHCLIYPSLLAM